MSEKDRILGLAAQWLEWDANPSTRKEIQDLVDKGDIAQLTTRLGSRIAFGTAGAYYINSFSLSFSDFLASDLRSLT